MADALALIIGAPVATLTMLPTTARVVTQARISALAPDLIEPGLYRSGPRLRRRRR